MLPLTKEQYQKLFPYALNSKISTFCDPLNQTLEKYQINTKFRIAAFLAQIEVESGSLRYVEEIADGKAYDKRKDLGNLDPEALAAAMKAGVNVGTFYKGHGLIQITGFYNHKLCGRALGLDLVNNPKELTKPLYAALSAGWFWESRNLNTLAEFGEFNAITKRINGGFNGKEARDKAYIRNLTYLSELCS